MARPRRALPQLSPGQASYVLQRLISDRRLSAGDVSRYMSDMQREIDELQRRLEALRAASGGSGAARFGGGAPRGRRAAPAGAALRRRRRPAVTAERRASQQLQGRYLGLIRQIPASRRAHYQKIAKDKGREAAIKEMTSTLGK